MAHVVWDWNGTLFDDLHLLAECSSLAMQAIGCEPMDVETYRRWHTRPLSLFYERAAGRPLTEAEWLTINDSFHSSYESMLDQAGLAADALDALDAVANSGSTQSLLSMWVHDSLVPFTAKHGVDMYFTRIDGLRVAGGQSKQDSLTRHLDLLGLQTKSLTIIGDTVDDGVAAKSVGIECVLVSTGAQLESDLKATGWPVAATLSDAATIALNN